MKRLFRWGFRLLILFVVLVVAAILLLDTVAREIAVNQLRNETGLEVKIDRLNIGLLNPEFTIENLVLYNTPEFGGSPFIEMPELHVEYDRSALWSRKLHCRLVRFNLAAVNVVEDKNGRRNFDVLQSKTQPPRAKLPPAKSTAQPELRFAGIDALNLTLGKATYVRLNEPGKVDELKMNVDHQVFRNIRTEQDFSGVMMVALLRSGVNLMPGGKDAPNWLQLLGPQKK